MTSHGPVRDPGGSVPGRWWHAARCVTVPLGVFFPKPYRSHSEAKACCEGCEVRAECLMDAFAVQERYGIRGGFNMGDQRSRRRASQWLEDSLKSGHDRADTSIAS